MAWAGRTPSCRGEETSAATRPPVHQTGQPHAHRPLSSTPATVASAGHRRQKGCPALTSHSADVTSIYQPVQGGRFECRPGVTFPADSQPPPLPLPLTAVPPVLTGQNFRKSGGQNFRNPQKEDGDQYRKRDNMEAEHQTVSGLQREPTEVVLRLATLSLLSRWISETA